MAVAAAAVGKRLTVRHVKIKSAPVGPLPDWEQTLFSPHRSQCTSPVHSHKWRGMSTADFPACDPVLCLRLLAQPVSPFGTHLSSSLRRAGLLVVLALAHFLLDPRPFHQFAKTTDCLLNRFPLSQNQFDHLLRQLGR